MASNKKTENKDAKIVLLLFIPFLSGVIVWGIVMALIGVIWPDAPNAIRSVASLVAFMLGMVMGALIERRVLSRKSDE